MPPKKKKRAIPRPVYFQTTIPVVRRCARCGVWLAAALVDGLHVLVDLVQLDPVQAALAALANVQLYSPSPVGFVHMYQERWRDSKHTGRMPEHRCGVVWEPRVSGAGPTTQLSPDDIPPY